MSATKGMTNGFFKLWWSQNFAGKLVLVTGIYLHLSAILLGRDLFLEKLFTPEFDMVLGIPMTYAGIMGIVLWKRTAFPSKFHTGVYAFILFYFCVSIVIHLSTFVTQDSSYITKFPEFFSFLIIPVQAFFLYIFSSASYKKG